MYRCPSPVHLQLSAEVYPPISVIRRHSTHPVVRRAPYPRRRNFKSSVGIQKYMAARQRGHLSMCRPNSQWAQMMQKEFQRPRTPASPLPRPCTQLIFIRGTLWRSGPERRAGAGDGAWPAPGRWRASGCAYHGSCPVRGPGRCRVSRSRSRWPPRCRREPYSQGTTTLPW